MSSYEELEAKVDNLSSQVVRLDYRNSLNALRFTASGGATPDEYYERFCYLLVLSDPFNEVTPSRLRAWYRKVVDEYSRVTGYIPSENLKYFGLTDAQCDELCDKMVLTIPGVFEGVDELVSLTLEAVRSELSNSSSSEFSK